MLEHIKNKGVFVNKTSIKEFVNDLLNELQEINHAM